MAVDSSSSNENGVAISERTQVAVIGGGIAGLTSALHLSNESPDEFDVTLMESEDRWGGHCVTVRMPFNGRNIAIDPGVTLFFADYDVVLKLFKHTNTDIQRILSYKSDDGNPGFLAKLKVLWEILTSSGIFSYIFKPWFYHMFYDMWRLYWNIPKFLKLQEDDPRKYSVTLNEYFQEGGYSKAVQDLVAYPMLNVMYIQGSGRVSQNGAFHGLRMLRAILGGLVCYVAVGGLDSYLDRLAAMCKGVLEKNTKVTSVTRNGNQWVVKDSTGKSRSFDKVVFAVNPSVVMKLLGDSATEEENDLLSRFEETELSLSISTHRNEKGLEHIDDNPSLANAGFGWDIPGTPLNKQPYPCYIYNGIFSLERDEILFVSSPDGIPPGFNHVNTSHFNVCSTIPPEAGIAQEKLLEMNGKRGIYFTGGWLGAFLHEDAARSALIASCDMNKRPVPWAPKYNPENKTMPWPCSINPRGVTLESLFMPTRLIVYHSFGLVSRFLRRCIEKGYITLVLPDMTRRSFGNPKQKTDDELVLHVFDWNFFVRAAYDFNVGFANSYIEGEIAFGGDKGSVHRYGDELVRFFRLLGLNQCNENEIKAFKMRSITESSGMAYITSVVMLVAIWLYTMFFLRNTGIERLRKNFQKRYAGLGDCSSKIYLSDYSEETAQLKAIDRFIEYAQLKPEHYVLDISCGYGTACIRAAETIGCHVIGVTDSQECKSFAEEVINKKGLSHLVQIHVVDYKVFSIQRRNEFDRVISWEMIDSFVDERHVHLPTFSRAVSNLLKPGGQLIFETIAVQNDSYKNYLQRNYFVGDECPRVFPGINGSTISSLLQSVLSNSSLSLDSIDNTSVLYSRMLWDCCHKLNEMKNRCRLRELGYNSYFIRCWSYYFIRCTAGLEDESLSRLTFKFTKSQRKTAWTY